MVYFLLEERGIQMSQTNVWKQFAMARKSLLKAVQTIPESVVDVQPAGFNNTLHWNVGHVLTVAENFLLGLANEEYKLPEEYKTFFGNGTKPSDWNGEAPAYSLLLSQLEEQFARAEAKIQARVDELLEKPITLGSYGIQFDTIGELLNMATYHESNHTGYINALRRVVTVL